MFHTDEMFHKNLSQYPLQSAFILFSTGASLGEHKKNMDHFLWNVWVTCIICLGKWRTVFFLPTFIRLELSGILRLDTASFEF
jgi:hypothetical protein